MLSKEKVLAHVPVSQKNSNARFVVEHDVMLLKLHYLMLFDACSLRFLAVFAHYHEVFVLQILIRRVKYVFHGHVQRLQVRVGVSDFVFVV